MRLKLNKLINYTSNRILLTCFTSFRFVEFYMNTYIHITQKRGNVLITDCIFL